MIFSCTRVAVHPNVPCPKKRSANGWIERYIWNPLLLFAEHRFSLLICALLVPEYVLARAIRQFMSARKITNENKSEYKTSVIFFIILNNSLLDRRWSTTHRFLVVMGGFHLFERSPKDTSRDDQGISPEDLRDGSLDHLHNSCTAYIYISIDYILILASNTT